VIGSTQTLSEIVRQSFINTEVNRIFPVLGNHDYYPFGQQEFLHPDSNKMHSSVADYWSNWLNKDTLTQFRQFGYYSQVLIFDDDTKLIPPQYTKVIGLNTLACSNTNFATFRTMYDPGDQLAWLEGELQDLEDWKGQAIIIGH
jgi:hypothetical protein